MTQTFKFDLVSPERVLISEQVEQVVVPGVEGEFGVLAGHAPVIATLRPGVIKVTLPTAGLRRIYVKSGFAEVDPSSLTILADSAFIVDEADPRQIEDELRAAEAALAEARDDEARFHVARAIDELKALTSRQH